MVVINNTHLSPEQALANLKQTTRGNLLKKFLFSFVLLLGGTLITIFSVSFNDGQYKSYLLIGLVFLLFGLGHAVYNIYNMISAEKKIKKNNDAIMQSGVDYSYKFKEQSIQLTAHDALKTFRAEYKYNEVASVYEYNDYYEMKLKTNQVLYIDKSGFQDKKMIEFFVKNLSINKKKIKNRKK